MWPSAVRNSIRCELMAAIAAWRAMMIERWDDYGRGGYFAIWAIRPLFDLGIAALIYAGGRHGLVPYVVVAMSANVITWTAVFWVGEILDRQRQNGTLVSLFVTPCARLSWLLGYAGAGLVQMLSAALATLLCGTLVFGVRFDVHLGSLLLAGSLFLIALTGLGLILSGIGLVLKKANQLANLVFPVMTLLGGVYYPVVELPTPLRILARGLPLGYGMEAISGAALHHAGPVALAPALIPLALFAIVLPLVGAIVFHLLGRLVRQRGELDLY